MSQEDVEIVRRAFAAFNARDKVNWLDLAAPGLEIHPVPDWPENAVVHGRDAAWSFLVGNEDVWETTGYTLTETIDAEDHVFACAEQRVAGRESGVPGELRFFCVFQVADDVVVRVNFFLTRDQALEAAGLRD